MTCVQAEFEKFGSVTDVYNTGKGYAFVTFSRFARNTIIGCSFIQFLAALSSSRSVVVCRSFRLSVRPSVMFVIK